MICGAFCGLASRSSVFTLPQSPKSTSAPRRLGISRRTAVTARRPADSSPSSTEPSRSSLFPSRNSGGNCAVLDAETSDFCPSSRKTRIPLSGVLEYAAQGNPQSDDEIAKKRRFWTRTSLRFSPASSCGRRCTTPRGVFSLQGARRTASTKPGRKRGLASP